MRQWEGPMYAVLGHYGGTTGVRNKRGFVAICTEPYISDAVTGADWFKAREEAKCEWHDATKLLAAAYTSYDRAFGKNAVAAAEADALGEAIRLLRQLTHGLPELLESIGYTDEEGLISEATDFLARVPEGGGV